jgi:hypothetical protein
VVVPSSRKTWRDGTRDEALPLSGGVTQLPIRATFNSSSETGPAEHAVIDSPLNSSVAAIFESAMTRSLTEHAFAASMETS